MILELEVLHLFIFAVGYDNYSVAGLFPSETFLSLDFLQVNIAIEDGRVARLILELAISAVEFLLYFVIIKRLLV